MNWDQIEGNWKIYRGKIKERWGKFTDNDLDTIAGKRDQLIGRLQKKYGLLQEDAEHQVKEFLGWMSRPETVLKETSRPENLRRETDEEEEDSDTDFRRKTG